MPTDPQPFLSTSEAMKNLNFRTPDGVIAFLRREDIPGIRIGRRLFWRESDVTALLIRLTNRSALPKGAAHV
jgi:hypothetical protein